MHVNFKKGEKIYDHFQFYSISHLEEGVSSMSDTTIASLSNEVLTLFGLEREDIESLSVNHQKDGVHLDIKLIKKPYQCPVCGNVTTKVRGYQTKTITHSVLTNHQCVIDYHARRMECPHCHKTFYEKNPFSMHGSRISLATVYNILNDLKSPHETFKSVADRYHVSPTTVAYIFDRHVNVSRRQLPEYLCLDEVYAFKSYRSRYVCVMLDYSNKKIVDLLPSRKKADLMDYFFNIPLKERERVKIVSFDMWETYRIVANIMFPNCKCAVDKLCKTLHK